MSGLQLNLAKCVLVSLQSERPEDTLAMLTASNTGWTGIEISFHAKYLGTWLGRASGLLNWEAHVAKCRTKIYNCSRTGAGLTMC